MIDGGDAPSKARDRGWLFLRGAHRFGILTAMKAVVLAGLMVAWMACEAGAGEIVKRTITRADGTTAEIQVYQSDRSRTRSSSTISFYGTSPGFWYGRTVYAPRRVIVRQGHPVCVSPRRPVAIIESRPRVIITR